MIKSTEPGKNYAKITFPNITVSDNSGEKVDVSCVKFDQKCQYEFGKTYNFNITTQRIIQFNAVDLNNNLQKCKINITVLGMIICIDMTFSVQF